MAFAQLTKSKKAILINVGDGRIFVTSVAYMRGLVDGVAHGNMIFLTELTKAKDNGLGSLDKNIKPKAKDVSGFEGFN